MWGQRFPHFAAMKTSLLCKLPLLKMNKQTKMKQTNKKTQAPKGCHLDQVPKLGLDTSSNCDFNPCPQKCHLNRSICSFSISANEYATWALSIPQRKKRSPAEDCLLFPLRESHLASNNPLSLAINFLAPPAF